jgi:hypothetical protein
VKELLPILDPYELTLLPNRMFWIRPLIHGQSVEAFTGETITIKPGQHDARNAQSPPIAAMTPDQEDIGE